MTPKSGVFTLSLDTEIAWGTFDHGGLQRYADHFRQVRPVTKRLVSLLDRYNTPATWAFVGHLLLDACERSNDGSIHPDVMRPRYRWYPGDWHDQDPGTDVRRNPWWYAPDVLENVLGSSVPHEIGTHTFSHIVVDDPDCTREIFRSQLQACVKAHRRYGLDIQSIVYPRNKVAYLDVLADFGITVYRGAAERPYAGKNPTFVKGIRLLDHTLPVPPPTYQLASPGAGMPTNVPASLFYVPRDGFRRAIPMAARVHKCKLGLKRAAQRGELFHLWFHPFNLASDPALFTGLEEILRMANVLRDAGRLEILTMYGAAERARSQA